MNAQTLLRRRSPSAVLAGACLMLAALTPPAAFAAPPSAGTGNLQAGVSLSDLDLATAQGMRTAQQRLRKKAEHLCRQQVDSASASFRWTYAACVREALADATQQLNPPTLAATQRAPARP